MVLNPFNTFLQIELFYKLPESILFQNTAWTLWTRDTMATTFHLPKAKKTKGVTTHHRHPLASTVRIHYPKRERWMEATQADERHTLPSASSKYIRHASRVFPNFFYLTGKINNHKSYFWSTRTHTDTHRKDVSIGWKNSQDFVIDWELVYAKYLFSISHAASRFSRLQLEATPKGWEMIYKTETESWWNE